MCECRGPQSLRSFSDRRGASPFSLVTQLGVADGEKEGGAKGCSAVQSVSLLHSLKLRLHDQSLPFDGNGLTRSLNIGSHTTGSHLPKDDTLPIKVSTPNEAKYVRAALHAIHVRLGQPTPIADTRARGRPAFCPARVPGRL